MVIVGVLYALKSHKGQIYGGHEETMIEKVVVSSKHKGINNNLMVVVVVVGGRVVCVYGGDLLPAEGGAGLGGVYPLLATQRTGPGTGETVGLRGRCWRGASFSLTHRGSVSKRSYASINGVCLEPKAPINKEDGSGIMFLPHTLVCLGELGCCRLVCDDTLSVTFSLS